MQERPPLVGSLKRRPLLLSFRVCVHVCTCVCVTQEMKDNPGKIKKPYREDEPTNSY